MALYRLQVICSDDKRFLFLASPDHKLRNVLKAMAVKYRKLYSANTYDNLISHLTRLILPSARMDKIQDQNFNDLDLDYRCGDVFSDNDVVRLLLEGSVVTGGLATPEMSLASYENAPSEYSTQSMPRDKILHDFIARSGETAALAKEKPSMLAQRQSNKKDVSNGPKESQKASAVPQKVGHKKKRELKSDSAERSSGKKKRKTVGTPPSRPSWSDKGNKDETTDKESVGKPTPSGTKRQHDNRIKDEVSPNSKAGSHAEAAKEGRISVTVSPAQTPDGQVRQRANNSLSQLYNSHSSGSDGSDDDSSSASSMSTGSDQNKTAGRKEEPDSVSKTNTDTRANKERQPDAPYKQSNTVARFASPEDSAALGVNDDKVVHQVHAQSTDVKSEPNSSHKPTMADDASASSSDESSSQSSHESDSEAASKRSSQFQGNVGQSSPSKTEAQASREQSAVQSEPSTPGSNSSDTGTKRGSGGTSGRRNSTHQVSTTDLSTEDSDGENSSDSDSSSDEDAGPTHVRSSMTPQAPAVVSKQNQPTADAPKPIGLPSQSSFPHSTLETPPGFKKRVGLSQMARTFVPDVHEKGSCRTTPSSLFDRGSGKRQNSEGKEHSPTKRVEPPSGEDSSDESSSSCSDSDAETLNIPKDRVASGQRKKGTNLGRLLAKK